MQLKELYDKKYNKVIDYLLSQLIPYLWSHSLGINSSLWLS